MSTGPEGAGLSSEPGWVERAVTLRDYFDDYTTLRVAQPQPGYGMVQLNATFKGQLISVDVNADHLLAALRKVMGQEEMTPEEFDQAFAAGTPVDLEVDLPTTVDMDELLLVASQEEMAAGHLFEISLRMWGVSRVVGDPTYTQQDWTLPPHPVFVRAWDLPAALKKAAGLPIDAWIDWTAHEDD